MPARAGPVTALGLAQKAAPPILGGLQDTPSHMHTLLRCLAVATGLAAVAAAQAQTILFTGRFAHTSRDSVNERPGGSITRLEEFDFSFATPDSVNGAIARTLLPATAMQCYLGDGNNDGVFTKFAGWKSSAFQDINIGSIFVKAADRGAVTWDKVYFTLRRNAASTAGGGVGTRQLEVLTNSGTVPYTLVPGDWLRLRPNGDVEFFMTAAQLAVAAGAQSGASQIGAGSLLQAANGDLYYAPVDGGHWVNGNQGPVNAQDASICKIDAANITYDAQGNVAAFAPNSARVLINAAAGGPLSSLSTRGMLVNSGAVDRFGAALAATSLGKNCGLAFDPNGGTWTPSYTDFSGAGNPEPNLLFVGNGGGLGGTIISTANNGSIAVINGVLCGSNTVGVPANGSWLGVNQDANNFLPTLIGFTLCDAIAEQPLVLDQNGFGRLGPQATTVNWEMDVHGTPNTAVIMVIDLGIGQPGGISPSLPTALLGSLVTSDSWDDLYLMATPQPLSFVLTDSAGYATLSLPNPNNGLFPNFMFMLHALALQPTALQVSTPLLVQLQ